MNRNLVNSLDAKKENQDKVQKKNWNGVLLINKPPGMTSHDVVSRVRRKLGMKEVGHAGTLDPGATGLLVLLLGQATKISDYLLNGDKGYRAGVRLGVETSTWDMDGEIVNQSPVDLTQEKILEATQFFQGSHELSVPKFSAIKVDGQRLYKKAFRGEDVVQLPCRQMNFKKIVPIEVGGDSLLVDITCSKGSYIRSWAFSLGKKLGVGACLNSLHRTYSSPYWVDHAIALNDFLESSLVGERSQSLDLAWTPLSHCLQHWPAVTIKGKDEVLMLNGQIPLELEKRLIPELKLAHRDQISRGIRIFSGSSGQLLSLLEAQPQRGLKIKRVFPPSF